MAEKKPNPDAFKLVREKYPTSFADDDGEWVRIKFTEEVRTPCPHCQQVWIRHEEVIGRGDCLGSGGSEKWAWHDAAMRLGLIKK